MEKQKTKEISKDSAVLEIGKAVVEETPQVFSEVCKRLEELEKRTSALLTKLDILTGQVDNLTEKQKEQKDTDKSDYGTQLRDKVIIQWEDGFIQVWELDEYVDSLEQHRIACPNCGSILKSMDGCDFCKYKILQRGVDIDADIYDAVIKGV